MAPQPPDLLRLPLGWQLPIVGHMPVRRCCLPCGPGRATLPARWLLPPLSVTDGVKALLDSTLHPHFQAVAMCQALCWVLGILSTTAVPTREGCLQCTGISLGAFMHHLWVRPWPCPREAARQKAGNYMSQPNTLST